MLQTDLPVDVSQTIPLHVGVKSTPLFSKALHNLLQIYDDDSVDGGSVANESFANESFDNDSFDNESIKNNKSQSAGLSKRHTKRAKKGLHLNDDSFQSETNMNEAMLEVIQYAKEVGAPFGYTVEHKKKITLYECQEYFHKVGGPVPDPANKRYFMKPDGGILFAIKDGRRIPILMTEVKDQGTNDLLFEQNKKRQSTGNAIERGAKNIRGAEMLFSGQTIFPYVIFASGCDFHHSETIAKRIEMMNMGVPNHYIEVRPDSTVENVALKLDSIVPSIGIKNICNKSIASVFVKAHKWNEMKHGASRWTTPEIVKVCKAVLDQVFKTLL